MGEVKLISAMVLTKDLINGYSILNGAKYFSKEDGSQNCLVFQPIIKYFQRLTNDIITGWKSNGLPYESIKSPAT